MFLPQELQNSIDKLLEHTDHQQLKKSSSHITDHYHTHASLTDKNALLAYLTTRLPATYAVIHTVLSSLPPPSSMIDFGAGPGTGHFAAQNLWGPTPTTNLEREQTFIELGQKLGCPSYTRQDITTLTSIEPHDLALFSYSLNELAPLNLAPIWNNVQTLVIIEPGTPHGTKTMLHYRDHIISLGGHVLAPCPHSRPCPLQKPNWCHFSVRVGRTEKHRQAKNASLPYEDEKYSYVILTKENKNPGAPRLLSSPEKHTGHVRLHLCTEEGIEKRTYSKKDKELYKKARKAKWGDPI